MMLKTRIDLVVSFTLALVVFGVAVGVSFSALAPLRAFLPDLGTTQSHSFPAQLAVILTRNIPAAVFLFSGLATGGVSSAIGLVLIGSFVGATTAASAQSVGLVASLSSVVPYAPVEFIGLLLAATGGLLPIVRVAIDAIGRNREGAVMRGRPYLSSFPQSLILLVTSIIVLCLAASIEASLIISRGG